MESTRHKFPLAVCQSAPRFGDVARNAEALTALTSQVQADLLLTPELSLTGYDLRDRVHEVGVATNEMPRLVSVPTQRAVAIGFVETSDQAIPYNSAVVVYESAVLHRHRKVHLPTYGMFDEARYFGRGDTVQAFELNGWRFGLLICEDFWHPSLVYLLACQRIDVLLVMAAAPGRGAWQGGEHNYFGSADVWERIARAYAQLYGIYVALCNRVGVEGAVTFAGGSLVVAPSGRVLARAGGAEEVLAVELDRAALLSARRPYAHLRDEDPAFVQRELTRIAALP
jgi:predicted amidohydrolase